MEELVIAPVAEGDKPPLLVIDSSAEELKRSQEKNVAQDIIKKLTSELEHEKSLVAPLTKEKNLLEKEKQSLEKEKNNLEKELKKVNAVIQKAKEKMALQQLMEENSKLRAESELMNDYKTQYTGLKENIHGMTLQADISKKEMGFKLATALFELNQYRINEGKPSIDGASISIPQIDESLKDQLSSLLKDKADLQERLQNQSNEMIELKQHM